MQIDARQFGEALAAALLLENIDDLREAAGSGVSRSYFVESTGRVFPLKAILRLAYRRERIPWDRPQSSKAARLLRPTFKILHITEKSERARLERQRKSADRWARDPQFRADVLDLYNSTCVVSGCTTLDAIDAAHLLGVSEEGEDKPKNGVVFRADLHRLFDARPPQMSINPRNLTVRFSADCVDHYKDYEGLPIVLPEEGPKAEAFAAHWKAFDSAEPDN